MLMFVFLYRSGEGFLLVEAPLFLQGSLESGGLGLTLKQKGLIDGTVSTVISMLGGLLGGMYIAKRGLPRALFRMALAMNIPHVCYVVLSQQASADQPLGVNFASGSVALAANGCGTNGRAPPARAASPMDDFATLGRVVVLVCTGPTRGTSA